MNAFVSKNPYSGELYNVYDFESYSDIELKISRALDAYKIWRKYKINERGVLFLKLASILRKNASSLGRVITEEMGKPFDQSVSEINKSALVCEYYAENTAANLAVEDIYNDNELEGRLKYEPMGLILQVMPWNFPFWQVFRCSAATLMAGNVSILKHAPNVPRCSLLIEGLFEQAGFPKAVFQQVFADIDAVSYMLNLEATKGVALTGSLKAGSSVGALAGKNIKASVLELGGSDAFIVLDDADLENAAQNGVLSRFSNNGQTCIAAKRFIVMETVADKFLNLLKKNVGDLIDGNPFHKGVSISTMARPDLAEELQKQVEISIKMGAKVEFNGGYKGDGRFKPMIISNIHKDSPAYKEELFGPVLSFFRVNSIEDALLLANDTDFGLGASIWTRDIFKGYEISSELEVGVVAVNQIVKSAPFMPFGGVKKSGIGRELGLEGSRSFVNKKSVIF